MKTAVGILMLFQLAFANNYDHTKILNQYEYMSPPKALLKWKIKKNDKKILSNDFKKLGSMQEKTQYLINLAQVKNFIGKNRSAVIDSLGEPESYFFSEQNATYDLLKIDSDQWVVSFEVSSDQIVREIKIAKSCCYGVK